MVCGDQDYDGIAENGSRASWNNFESQREKTADLETLLLDEFGASLLVQLGL